MLFHRLRKDQSSPEEPIFPQRKTKRTNCVHATQPKCRSAQRDFIPPCPIAFRFFVSFAIFCSISFCFFSLLPGRLFNPGHHVKSAGSTLLPGIKTFRKARFST